MMNDPFSVDLDLSRARRILKLVLGIGSVLLASGARTSDVEQTMEAMASALGAPGVEAGVTFSSISVSVIVGAEVEPLTVVRMVRDRSSDYTRLGPRPPRWRDPCGSGVWARRGFERTRTHRHVARSLSSDTPVLRLRFVGCSQLCPSVPPARGSG